MTYKWTKRLSLFTPLFLLIALFLMGGGHGTYIPMMLIFPWGSLLLIWKDYISVFTILLAIVQFPVYGLIIDKLKISVENILPLFVLILLHIIAGTLVVFFNTGFK